MRGRALLFIEIKTWPVLYAGIEDRLVDALRTAGDLRPAQAQDSCFQHIRLRRIADLAPHIPTGILYVGRPVDPLYDARLARARALHPNWACVTAEDVGAAHGAGLTLNTWRVNDPAAVVRLAAMGVDGIITDDPVMARRAVGSPA